MLAPEKFEGEMIVIVARICKVMRISAGELAQTNIYSNSGSKKRNERLFYMQSKADNRDKNIREVKNHTKIQPIGTEVVLIGCLLREM